MMFMNEEARVIVCSERRELHYTVTQTYLHFFPNEGVAVVQVRLLGQELVEVELLTLVIPLPG